MLELAQVVQIVVNGQALLTDPVQRFREPALCKPAAHLLRRDGTNVGNDAPDIESLGFVEHAHSAIKVALNPLQSRPGNAPAITRLGQVGELAQLRAVL